MHSLAILIGARLNSALNRIRHFQIKDLPAEAASFVVFSGFALTVFFVARSATLYLLRDAHIGLFLLHRFLSMVLYVLFLTVNLGNVVVCYATLYRSDEVSFLMALPVKPQDIFVAKFLDIFFTSSLILMLVGLSLFFGYASVFSFPWYFYPITIIFVHLPFLLLSGMLAVVSLVALVALASRFGVRRLLAISIAAYLVTVFIYFKLTDPTLLVSEVMKHFPFIDRHFGEYDPVLVRYLPNHWVAEYLYWSVVGNTAAAMGYLGRLLVALTGVSLVVWLMGRFVYYRSWLAATEVQTVRGKGHVLLDSSKMGFGRPLLHNGQMDVIVKRDFWMFIRDPGQWVHLLLMFLLLGAFLFSLSTLDTATDHPFMRTVSFLSLLLFDGLLLSSMALRFVFPAVSLEGESFWCVRSAPVDLRTLYHEKFLGAFLLLLLTSQILAAVSVGLAHQPIPLIIAATLAMSAEAFAFAGLHLSTGARFALFREKSPVRVASSHGATLTFLMSMAYLAIVTIVLAGPVQRYFEECTSTSTGSAYLVLLPVGIVVVLSLVIGVIANHYGTRDFVRGI